MTRRQGHEEVEVSSQINATFSVGLCAKSEGSTVCQTTKTRTIHVVGITCQENPICCEFWIQIPKDIPLFSV